MSVLRKFVVMFATQTDTTALDEFERKAGGLVKTLAGVTAGAIATTAALFVNATQVADTADVYAKTAQQLGLTIEELQELKHAAELSGAGMDDVHTAMRRQADVVDKANKGSKQQVALLKRLKIRTRDANGETRKQIDIFTDIAGSLKGVKSETERVALANQVFGRSGSKLLPLVNAGAEGFSAMRQEARDLGIVLDRETAAKAELFNDTLLRTKRSSEGLRTQFTTRMIPSLTRLLMRFNELVATNRDVIGQRLDRAADLVAKAFDYAGEKAGEFDAWVKKMGGYDEIFSGIASVIGAIGTMFAAKKLVAGISFVISGFKLIAAVGIIPMLKIVAVVTAIVVAFAALVLVFQDLITYFRGGDSVIGRLVERFRESEGAGGAVARIFERIKGVALKLFDVLKRVGEPLFRILAAGAKGYGKVMMKVFNTIADEVILPFITFVLEKFEGWLGTVEEGLGELLKVWDGTIGSFLESAATFAEEGIGAWSEKLEEFIDLLGRGLAMVRKVTGAVANLDPRELGARAGKALDKATNGMFGSGMSNIGETLGNAARSAGSRVTNAVDFGASTFNVAGNNAEAIAAAIDRRQRRTRGEGLRQARTRGAGGVR